MQENNPIFTFNYNYTYSLRETAEIQKIRDKYRLTREENDFEQLKKLDRDTCRRSKLVAIFICLISLISVIIGLLMIILPSSDGKTILSVFGKDITASSIIGIFLTFVGIILACIAYPLYKKILKHDKRIAAPRILEMSARLLEN